MADPHGPNTLENYITVHESYMADFLAKGFVVEDGCVFTPFKTRVSLDGLISCSGGIQLEVAKDLGYLSGTGRRALVKTKAFSYHARVKGRQNILRYEFNHDHRGYAHKHTYDPFRAGREISVEELTSTHEVPHLADVIDELRAFYEANRDQLPEPENDWF